MATDGRAPARTAARTPPAQPFVPGGLRQSGGAMRQPVRRDAIASDPGYARILGGPVPVIVQAKPSWARPGMVTAAAVMGFILAGLCVLAAITWLTVSDFQDRFGGDNQKTLVFGLVNLSVAIAFVLGGIGTVSRQQWGRFVLMGGAAGHAVYALYRALDSIAGLSGIIFIFTGVTIIALLATPAASRYFASRSPLGYE